MKGDPKASVRFKPALRAFVGGLSKSLGFSELLGALGIGRSLLKAIGISPALYAGKLAVAESKKAMAQPNTKQYLRDCVVRVLLHVLESSGK